MTESQIHRKTQAQEQSIVGGIATNQSTVSRPMRVVHSVPEQLLPDHVPDDVAEEEGGVRRD